MTSLKELQNLHNGLSGKAARIFAGACRGYCVVPPVFIKVILTYRCNLSCEFCSQPRPDPLPPDITLKDIEILERNIRNSFPARPRLHLFGGEPSIHEDFSAIAGYLNARGYAVSASTNGALLYELRQAFSGMREINVSLNTADLGGTQETLARFGRSKEGRRARVTLACPVTDFSRGRLAGIVERFQDAPVQRIVFQHTTLPGPLAQGRDMALFREAVAAVKKTRFRIPVSFFPDIRAGDIGKYYCDFCFPGKKCGCLYPWFVLLVRPDMSVAGCNWLQEPLGDARQEKLSGIWNGPLYRQFRDRALYAEAKSAPCARCCHRTYY